MQLEETPKLPKTQARMRSKFINTTGYCMELYIQITGISPGRITVISRDEYMNETEVKRYENLTNSWTRLYLELPDKINVVFVQGTRSKKGLSGLAVDDIIIWPCAKFGEFGL